MATVKRSNPKAFETITAKLKELDGLQTSAGWTTPTQYETGVSVAQVAQWQEFGEGKIPPRPFMRPAITENKAKWLKLMGQGAQAVLNGTRKLFDVMSLIGTEASSDIAKAIVAVTAPPLSPITLELRAMKRKGIEITGRTVGEAARKVNDPDYQTPNVSTKPLVDSGIMLASVTYVVEPSK